MLLTDTEPMEPQLNKLMEVNRNLETIRCRVNDKALAYIIVMALPDLLLTLQAILFSTDNVTIILEAVVAQILADKESRVNLSGGSTSAYFTKAGKKGVNGKNQEKNQDKKRCTYCKKRGHKALGCNKKKKFEEEKANASKVAGAGSGSSVTKANVTIAEDNLITLINPSEDMWHTSVVPSWQPQKMTSCNS